MDLPQLSPEELARDGSRAAMVVGVVSMCMGVSAFVLALRLGTRYWIVRRVGWDDYAAVCLLLSISGCGASIALNDLVNLLKCFFCSIIFYGLGHLSFKMSFLIQSYKVLCTPRTRRIYIAAMVFVGLWGTINFFVAFTFCDPLNGFWDPRVDAKCWSRAVLFYVFVALSITTDLVIFLLPLPALYKLKIPRSQKVYLIGIFSLGFLIVVIAVIRLQFLNIGPDFSWGNVDPALWSLGELSAAMMCLCLPPLKALGLRLGLFGTEAENPKPNPPPSAEQIIRLPLTPGPKTVDTETTNSPREPPVAFGIFVEEAEPFNNGVFRQTPSLAIV